MNVTEDLILLQRKLADKGHFFSVETEEPDRNGFKKLLKKISLPDELIQFYTLHNGFNIAWVAETGTFCTGRMFVPDIKLLSIYLTTNKYPFSQKYKSLLEQNYIPIDIDEPNNYCTFIHPTKDNYEIVCVNPIGQIFQLECDLKTYFEKGISVGGLYFWKDHLSVNSIVAELEVTPDEFGFLLDEHFGIDYRNSFFNLNDSVFFPRTNHEFKVPKGCNIIHPFKKVNSSFLEIRLTELKTGRKLPVDLTVFFLEFNGMDSKWQLGNIAGNLKVLRMEVIFGGRDFATSSVWDNSYGKYLGIDRKDYNDVYPFMFDDVGHTVFGVQSGEIQLYYITDTELIPVKLTFSQFTSKLFMLGGINGWPLYFTDHLLPSNPEMIQLTNQIDSIFPESEWRKV